MTDAGSDGDAAAPGADAGPAVVPAASLWASDALPPFDDATVAHVRAVHAAGATRGNRDTVFMKMGDSISSNPAFLQDVGAGNYTLGAYGALDPTIKAFLSVVFDDNSNSFQRDSMLVQSGLTTRDVMQHPEWIATEEPAIHPAFAFMMFGTDDLDIMEVDEFVSNVNHIVDAVEGDGTIIAISTLPWRPEYARAEMEVPIFNDAIRKIAATRHLPYVDLIKALDPLPHRGISDDDVHPTVELLADGGTNAGDFTPTGLQYGFNVRNLTTIQMLDRLRAVVR